MKAEDTVMLDEEIRDFYKHLSQPPGHPAVHRTIAKTQAKITWEARQVEIDSFLGQLKDLHELKRQAEITARQAGIQEVVDWIRSNSPFIIAGSDIFATAPGHEMQQDVSYYPVIRLVDWKEKFKEWGVK